MDSTFDLTLKALSEHCATCTVGDCSSPRCPVIRQRWGDSEVFVAEKPTNHCCPAQENIRPVSEAETYEELPGGQFSLF